MTASASGATRRLIAHPWLLPLLLLILGAVIRLAVVAPILISTPAEGELPNVAIAFATKGELAGAFRPEQGPTAHVLPIPALYAGLVYRALGVRSRPAELLLVIGATGCVLATFALLYRCFGLVGMPRAARLVALAGLCLFPVNLELETVQFRIWDTALGLLAAFACLYLLLVLERAPRLGTFQISVMAIAAALTFFINPALGLAIYLCSLLVLVERLPVSRWPGAIAIATMALLVVLGPWALRNQAVMGEAIPLRSNFGLELALGNHPAALAGSDQRQVFRNRLVEIHPYASAAAFARMQQAGGEVAYAKMLGRQAKDWIAENPIGFLKLSARHLCQYFFPPQWQWNIYMGREGFGRSETVIISVLAAAGLIGAAVAAVLSWRRYRFAIIVMLIPVLPYAIVQPVLRYRYIVFALTLFFAADLYWRLLAFTRSRSSA